MLKQLNISVIGSCRVFTPIRLMEQRNVISSDHLGLEWYTHSTKDVLQKIAIARKKIVPEEKYIPLLVHGNGQYSPEHHHQDVYEKSDIIIIEIASPKLFLVEQMYLQQWCVRDVLASPEKFSEESVKLANLAQMLVQNKVQIKEDLSSICDALGKPVIFVNHINVLKPTGDLIPERNLIFESIREFCSEDCRAVHFDPTVHVSAFGEDEALSDSGHYKKDFEPILGELLVHMAQKLMSDISYLRLNLIDEVEVKIGERTFSCEVA